MIKTKADAKLFMDVMRFKEAINTVAGAVQNDYEFTSPHQITEMWESINKVHDELGIHIHNIRQHLIDSGVPEDLLKRKNGIC
jgi:hypothetical protein